MNNAYGPIHVHTPALQVHIQASNKVVIYFLTCVLGWLCKLLLITGYVDYVLAYLT